ncbi:hypothetical protein ABE28_010250 [Peribacillus muralis]|uniref:Uncharacterized protein n=1 Tax=Peribacillus muralis TaxID=264697 RepID=A0A1B3XNE2_9BACI|nr:hypothetical protein ABE28_010250 [Peribacillus muralis]
MGVNELEKQQLKKLRTFINNTLALFFFMVFIFVSMLILYFPMINILDFSYFPPKLAILSFLISLVFSILAIKNLIGKILLAVNIVLMLFMIIYAS